MKIFLFLKYTYDDLLWKQTPPAIFAFTSFTLYGCLIQTHPTLDYLVKGGEEGHR
jgi:hypothetical protein